jgi:hypothetical protein
LISILLDKKNYASTTIATQVALNELNNPKEKSPKKEEKKPEDKKNNKTLHEKLFGDIQELETKRDSKKEKQQHSEMFSSLSGSPMESVEKETKKL